MMKSICASQYAQGYDTVKEITAAGHVTYPVAKVTELQDDEIPVVLVTDGTEAVLVKVDDTYYDEFTYIVGELTVYRRDGSSYELSTSSQQVALCGSQEEAVINVKREALLIIQTLLRAKRDTVESINLSILKRVIDSEEQLDSDTFINEYENRMLLMA